MTDWQDIVSRHALSVWRTALRLLGNEADAADCLQETFLSALKLSREKRVRHWGGLLCRVATARALDRLRQRLRQDQRNEELADWMTVPCPNLSPPEHVQELELSAQLRKALAQLPPQQAAVFCMRCLDEMSYREIARQLDIKSNAVGVLLHRARTHLRELLAQVSQEQHP